jgi:hypothetical protein
VASTARSARWWELPREQQRQGVQGALALVAGTRVGITCPQCGQAPVVYNGNYFCDNYPGGGVHVECDWALAHPSTTKVDKEICDLIGIDYD